MLGATSSGMNQIELVNYMKQVACVKISENMIYVKHLYITFGVHQKQTGKQISPWGHTRFLQVLEKKAETGVVG